MDDGAIVLLYLVMAAVLALIPMSIASSKGRDAINWWAFGFILWIVALPAAILIKPTKRVEEEEALAKGDSKKCPQCAELVKREASKCRFCGHEFPPPGSLNCPGCGKLLLIGAVRCRFCGHVFQSRHKPFNPHL